VYGCTNIFRCWRRKKQRGWWRRRRCANHPSTCTFNHRHRHYTLPSFWTMQPPPLPFPSFLSIYPYLYSVLLGCLMFLSRTEQRVCRALTYLPGQLCQSQVFQINCMHALTPAKSTCADARTNAFQDERLHFKPLISRACLNRVACSPGCLASALSLACFYWCYFSQLFVLNSSAAWPGLDVLVQSFWSSLLLYTLWLCLDGLLSVICINHIKNRMLDLKTEHIQKIYCLCSLACYPCANWIFPIS